MAKKKNRGYWENVIKEFGEFRRARSYANQKEDEYETRNWGKPSSTDLKNPTFKVREKARAIEEEKSAKGQLAGAILQGRRYKKSGKQKNK
jgi:hypothetical protein